MSDVTDTYYAGEAFIGYGTQLMVGDGASPESFEAIADVIEITPGAWGTDVVEKTHLRSPTRHKEKLVAMRDSGPFVVKCNWRPTHESQSKAGGGSGAFASGGMLAKWISGEETNYKIVLSDGSPGTEVPFRGSVTKYQPGGIAGGQKVDMTIEITPLADFSSSLP
jgi:hypothetical protein